MSTPDAGLQAERTALSWRRTALAVVVGSLVGLRVLPSHLGPLAYVACVAGLLWSADLAWTSTRRYREADALVRGRSGGADPGAAVCRTAVMAFALGVVALLAVVAIA